MYWSRTAAANRLSNSDGHGRYAHISGARSFNQVRILMVSPSPLYVCSNTVYASGL